jgi:predicted MFS family arabinose efflux permease
VAIGLQIGQAIGWRRLASVAALAVLAGAVAKEWPGRDKAAEDDAAEDDDAAASED